jgi:transposase InsO family protein
MSGKGCRWDNAVVESFLYTLKHELDLNDDAKTLSIPRGLVSNLAFWVDGYYKRERRHSSTAYLGPIDYEQQFIGRLD